MDQPKTYEESAAWAQRVGDQANSYIRGYDDAVNDCLRWLQQSYPTVATELAVSIRDSSRSSNVPVGVRAEFLPAPDAKPPVPFARERVVN